MRFSLRSGLGDTRTNIMRVWQREQLGRSMGIRDEGMVMAVDKTILYRFIQNPFFLRRKPNLGEAKDETEVVDRLRNSSRSGSWVLR
jgi:hypothetical protein